MHAGTSDNSKARQIEIILERIESLPTLSPVASRLMQISSVQDADLDPIVELIESDLSLTSRILGLCRRADKGLGDRITTVRRAVVMLGLEAIQSVVLSVSVFDLMGKEAGAGPSDDPADAASIRFQRAEFWKHSIAVASAASLIAEAHPHLEIAPPEAFVAGLLHDMGKLVMEMMLPRSYSKALQLAERRASGSAHVERELFGLDHHTAAKRLSEHWGLPHALQDVMWLHSQPAGSIPDLPHKPLIGVVNAARALTRSIMLGWSGDYNNPPTLEGPSGVCATFGLVPDKVYACTERVHEDVAYRCAVLGLNNPSTAELMLGSIAAANQRLARLNTHLQQRSRGTQEQTRVLGLITDFHARWRAGRNLMDSLGDIVQSASEAFGPGFFGVVVQSRAGEPWQLVCFEPDGSAGHASLIHAPASLTGPGAAHANPHANPHANADLSLLSHAARGGIGVAPMALVPWITEHLEDKVDVRQLRILPLISSDESRGPTAILLHDREAADGLHERGTLRALASTWSSAIASALQHDGARRLGEKLAATNRDLVEAQSRLAERESMARLGEMAAGAAHEMNNPLTIISGRSQLLASRAGSETDRAAAQSIVAAAQHLSDLITSLRLLADPPAPSCAGAQLLEILRSAVERAEERTNCRGLCTIQADDHAIVTDRELLASAVAELIANALESMPESKVEIRAHHEPSDSRLMVLVKDHGPGMSARALHHAFDPFFSEKPAGRQTGLGLTRARRLVEILGGEISLQSLAGLGTTASVAVPLASATAHGTDAVEARAA